MRRIVKVVFWTGLLVTAAGLVWAENAIGVASGAAAFLVDRGQVQGNATIMEGAVVETRSSSSRLMLNNGLRLQLEPQSRAKVFAERVILEQGAGRLTQAGPARLVVKGLQVAPNEKDTQIHVALNPQGAVRVTALQGAAEVTTVEGLLLARVNAGNTLAFEPQAATAAPPYQVEGCLSAGAEGILLKDATTNVLFDLRGENLAHYAGRYVQVTASQWPNAQPAGGASQVLRVVQVKVLPMSCPAPSGRDNQPSRSTPTSHRSSGRTKAVVAGVAIAGGVAAATVGLTGDEQPPPTISR
ncbi:MAG: hypothetical protein K6T61_05145 [Bryobacteraceae bacterium]|nr:hypothetical protein [Bryobacteraceae bacterium]